MKSGTGTFVKLEEPFNMGSKRIASFGNSHMVVTTNSTGLLMTFIDGPKVNEALNFNRDEKVLIGRMDDCHIKMDESNALSRYQCSLYYDNDWYIEDGKEGRPSTNGTWIFADEPVTFLII